MGEKERGTGREGERRESDRERMRGDKVKGRERTKYRH